jgi:Tol biopolymer transport system component
MSMAIRASADPILIQGATALVYNVGEYDPEGSFYSNSIVTLDGWMEVFGTDDESRSNTCADLSPDGRKIIYGTNRDSNGESSFTHNEVYIADVDGTSERRLTFTEDDERAPRWSPDGTQIMFMATDDIEDLSRYEIYVMDADGDNLQQITHNTAVERFPSWSPDGTRIVFGSNQDGDFELYTMLLDGSDVQQLTDNDWTDARPNYSPDGTRIAFNSSPNGQSDIYIINVDGSGLERLTDFEDMAEYDVNWSPDGGMLAFTTNPVEGEVPSEIWVINADGSDVRTLFADEGFSYAVCDWGNAPQGS